jgi:hypothetical protein
MLSAIAMCVDAQLPIKEGCGSCKYCYDISGVILIGEQDEGVIDVHG